MTPNLLLSDELIPKDDYFNKQYYAQFQRRFKEISLQENVRKTYTFPTLYGNVDLSIIAFFCSYAKARDLILDDSLHPINMGNGRSLVVFSCYQYRLVNEIKSYNEVGISIPVISGKYRDLPIIPMLLSKQFPGFGYQVVSMPVTSLESKIRGEVIWGLPKKVETIRFTNDGDYNKCVVSDIRGNEYLILRIPMKGDSKYFDETTKLYTKVGNSLCTSQTWFSGKFEHRVSLSELLFVTGTSAPYLELAPSDSAKALHDLEIVGSPFITRYGSGVMSAFDLPKDCPAEYKT